MLRSPRQYLARYLYGVASFWSLLRRERLAPQRSRDGTALSMHQWRLLLSTTRVPGQHKDTIRAMFQTGERTACSGTGWVVCIECFYLTYQHTVPNDQ